MAKKKELSTAEAVETLTEFYYNEPVQFVIDIIGVKPTTQQEEVLKAIVHNKQISIKSGHGTGKTTVSSWICLWFIFTRQFSKIAVTAPTQKQLDQIFFPELQKWSYRSELMKSMLTVSKREVVVKGYNAYGIFSTSSSKQENLQGFHGEGGTLFIVDEASGVEDKIYEVVDGALTGKEDRLIMIGNPTKTRGTFYRSHNRDKANYKCITLSCLDSSNVSPEFEKTVAKKYGKHSDVYRVRVLGEFPLSDPDTFIARDLAESCIGRDADMSSRGMIGCDPSRFGDDATELFGSAGRNVIAHKVLYGKTDSNKICLAVGEMVLFLREQGVGGRVDVKIDENGIGAGVVDMLRLRAEELLINVKPINSSWSGDAEHERMKDWLWGNMKNMLEFISLPAPLSVKDDTYFGFEEETVGNLIDEICMRKYSLSIHNKIVLEKKSDLKKRGLPSPNSADAFSLLLWDGNYSNNLGKSIIPTMKKVSFKIRG